jgi:hypothetical protein
MHAGNTHRKCPQVIPQFSVLSQEGLLFPTISLQYTVVPSLKVLLNFASDKLMNEKINNKILMCAKIIQHRCIELATEVPSCKGSKRRILDIYLIFATNY